MTYKELFVQKYDQPLSKRFYMRITPKQKKLLKEAAELMNMEMSDFYRDIIDIAAPKIIESAKKAER